MMNSGLGSVGGIGILLIIMIVAGLIFLPIIEKAKTERLQAQAVIARERTAQLQTITNGAIILVLVLGGILLSLLLAYAVVSYHRPQCEVSYYPRYEEQRLLSPPIQHVTHNWYITIQSPNELLDISDQFNQLDIESGKRYELADRYS